MLVKSLLLGFFSVALVFGSAAVGCASEAEAEYQKGRALQTDGKMRAALKAYAAAVQIDRSNEKYAQQFMLVRQALKLQNALKRPSNPQRWELTAQALRAFYTSQGMFTQALPIDQQIFERKGTASSAIQLAETLLSLKRPEDAEKALSRLDADTATTASKALLCVALARQGKQNAAEPIEQSLTLGKSTDPGTLYIAARMQASLGHAEQTFATLTKCFESTPPSRLESLKSHAEQCQDFASFTSAPQFSEVIKTASKIPESKCSGGKSCSSCPMRGKCSHGKGN